MTTVTTHPNATKLGAPHSLQRVRGSRVLDRHNPSQRDQVRITRRSPARLRPLSSRPSDTRHKRCVQPVAMAAAASNRNETAMLVIDMQNDFILPGSPMCVAGGAAIVPSVARAVDVARERGIFVIWVVREHDPFGRDVELFRRHLYDDGKGPTTKGTKGAELVDGLVQKKGDYKLAKMRFSAFFDTHLHSLLQSSGINGLIVVGVQTPNCIRQSVYDAVALNYQPVTVIVDATAAATPEVHIANIQDMKNIGVAMPTLEEWCRAGG